MSNVDKAMELAYMVAARRYEWQQCESGSVSSALCEGAFRKSGQTLRSHIETMQRDLEQAKAQVTAWETRFPNYEYRAQDECVALKLKAAQS